jgi:hypothetical protein
MSKTTELQNDWNWSKYLIVAMQMDADEDCEADA